MRVNLHFLLCFIYLILELGGEDKHSDWLGAIISLTHYLRQMSTATELNLA